MNVIQDHIISSCFSVGISFSATTFSQFCCHVTLKGVKSDSNLPEREEKIGLDKRDLIRTPTARSNPGRLFKKKSLIGCSENSQPLSP